MYVLRQHIFTTDNLVKLRVPMTNLVDVGSMLNPLISIVSNVANRFEMLQMHDNHSIDALVSRFMTDQDDIETLMDREEQFIATMVTDLKILALEFENRAPIIRVSLETFAEQSTPVSEFIGDYEKALDTKLRILLEQRRVKEQRKRSLERSLERLEVKRSFVSVSSELSELSASEMESEDNLSETDKRVESICSDAGKFLEFCETAHSCRVPWSQSAGSFSSKNELSRDIYCRVCRRQFRVVWVVDEAITRELVGRGKNVPKKFFSSRILENVKCSIYKRRSKPHK